MIVNWSTDEEYMKNVDPEGYKRWRLVQLINYGGTEKISKSAVVKYWDKIKDELDIDGRKAIEFFLWGKRWTKEPGLRADRSNFLMWLIKSHSLKKASI